MPKHELSGKSGIYQIRNTVNGKVYVGSAIKILKRWREHKTSLRKGVHHSKHLQKAWVKYGEECFVFEVIEFIEPYLFYEVFAERELFWQNNRKVDNPDYGYNMVIGATPSEIVAANNRKRVWTEEAREAARLRTLGRTQTGMAAKGDNHFYAREYALISPEGEIHRGKSITHFGEKVGVCVNGLLGVVNGEYSQYKGWRNADNPKYRGAAFRFVSPEGVLHEGFGINAWCRKNNLSHSGFQKLHAGTLKSYKGWTCPGNGFVEKPRKDSPYYKLKSPDGVIYEGYNPSGFAKQMNLCRCQVHRLVKGQISNHRGWTKAE